MMTSDADHRPFGKTGLSVPPIVFRGDLLENAARVIPDQTKRVICGEWFQRVTPPVFIDVNYSDVRDAGLELLRRTLRRLDVSPDNVVIDLGMKCSAESPSAIGCDSIHARCDKACKSLGDAYAPRLVTIDARDAPLTAATSDADRVHFVKATLDAIHTIGELKSAKRIAGVGIRCSDWRIAKELSDATTLDFVALVGGFTIMRHPPELVEFLTSLAERQIAVISAGVFHGGFLVGGPKFEERTISPNAPNNQSLVAWRKAFASLCHGHGVRPAHACIQFALSAPGIVAVSLSTTHPDRVAENVESVVAKISNALWRSMQEEGLLAEGIRLPS